MFSCSLKKAGSKLSTNLECLKEHHEDIFYRNIFLRHYEVTCRTKYVPSLLVTLILANALTNTLLTYCHGSFCYTLLVSNCNLINTYIIIPPGDKTKIERSQDVQDVQDVFLTSYVQFTSSIQWG